MDSLTGLRVGIYARFSSDQQKDTSIADQVALCREYVVRPGGSIADANVFADFATSGATKDRPRLEALLRLVETNAIDVIITESMDRLSRDLGDADRWWKLIAFHHVRLICVSDGIDSSQEGARMQFRFKAIFADEFLLDLGKKTRRGQIGAMNRGHCTGGLPFGYASRGVQTTGGKQAFEILIHEAEASAVRRIFELYASGYSLLAVAEKLNSEGVPPPRATSKKRPNGFWRKSTLREMLGNRAYVGEWSYGKKMWRKEPSSRRRRYVKRSADEIITSDRPHLRIVSAELWEAVQQRRTAVHENYSGKGVGAPGHRTHKPFSGLLFCGLCQRRMIDAGGSTVRYYRCSGATTGGICSNKAPVREDAVVDAAILELNRLVHLPALQDQLRQKVAQRLKHFEIEAGAEERLLRRELSRLDGEVKRLISFIGQTEPSNTLVLETVRASLDEAVTKQREVKTKLESRGRQRSQGPDVPTVEEILSLTSDIQARIREAPIEAREMLRRILLNGMVTLTPNPDGSYQAKSMLLFGRIGGGTKTRKPRDGKPFGASGTATTSGGEVVEIDGCAGLLLDFPDPENRGVELWVPFEESIAIGW